MSRSNRYSKKGEKDKTEAEENDWLDYLGKKLLDKFCEKDSAESLGNTSLVSQLTPFASPQTSAASPRAGTIRASANTTTPPPPPDPTTTTARTTSTTTNNSNNNNNINIPSTGIRISISPQRTPASHASSSISTTTISNVDNLTSNYNNSNSSSVLAASTTATDSARPSDIVSRYLNGEAVQSTKDVQWSLMKLPLSVRSSLLTPVTNIDETFPSSSYGNSPLLQSGLMDIGLNEKDIRSYRTFVEENKKSISKVLFHYFSTRKDSMKDCPIEYCAKLSAEFGRMSRTGGGILAGSEVNYLNDCVPFICWMFMKGHMELSFDPTPESRESDCQNLGLALLSFSTERNGSIMQNYLRYAGAYVGANDVVIERTMSQLGHLSSALMFLFKSVWKDQMNVLFHCDLLHQNMNLLVPPTDVDQRTFTIRNLLAGSMDSCPSMIALFQIRSLASKWMGKEGGTVVVVRDEEEMKKGNFAIEFDSYYMTAKGHGLLIHKAIGILRVDAYSLFGAAFKDFKGILQGLVY